MDTVDTTFPPLHVCRKLHTAVGIKGLELWLGDPWHPLFLPFFALFAFPFLTLPGPLTVKASIHMFPVIPLYGGLNFHICTNECLLAPCWCSAYTSLCNIGLYCNDSIKLEYLLLSNSVILPFVDVFLGLFDLLIAFLYLYRLCYVSCKNCNKNLLKVKDNILSKATLKKLFIKIIRDCLATSILPTL